MPGAVRAAHLDRHNESSADVADQKNEKDCDGGDLHVIPASSRIIRRSPTSSNNGVAEASDNKGALEEPVEVAIDQDGPTSSENRVVNAKDHNSTPSKETETRMPATMISPKSVASDRVKQQKST